MTLTIEDYRNKKLGDFQNREEIFRRNFIIFTIITFCFMGIYLYLSYFLKIDTQQKTYISSAVMIYVIFLIIYLTYYLLPKKPLFKEYLLYYLWNSYNSLSKFSKDKSNKKELKKSKYFSKKFVSQIRLLELKETRLEVDEKRNNAIKDINLLIEEYVFPRLKLDIMDKEQEELFKIFEKLFSLTQTENFDEIHKFLSSYIETEVVSLKDRFKEKMYLSPIFLYMLVFGLIAIIFCLGVYFIISNEYGWVEVGIFGGLLFGLIPAIYSTYKLINITRDKIQSK